MFTKLYASILKFIKMFSLEIFYILVGRNLHELFRLINIIYTISHEYNTGYMMIHSLFDNIKNLLIGIWKCSPSSIKTWSLCVICINILLIDSSSRVEYNSCYSILFVMIIVYNFFFSCIKTCYKIFPFFLHRTGIIKTKYIMFWIF